MVVALLTPVTDGWEAREDMLRRTTTNSRVLAWLICRFLLFAQEEIFWSSFCAVPMFRDPMSKNRPRILGADSGRALDEGPLFR